MKLLVVCSNGISSGFIARRIKKCGLAEGFNDLEVKSISYQSFETENADLVLIGPFGEYVQNKMAAMCEKDKVPYLFIGHDDYVQMNAYKIFMEVRFFLERLQGGGK